MRILHPLAVLALLGVVVPLSAQSPEEVGSDERIGDFYYTRNVTLGADFSHVMTGDPERGATLAWQCTPRT